MISSKFEYKSAEKIKKDDLLLLSNDVTVRVLKTESAEGGTKITNDRYGETFAPTGTRFRVVFL